MGKKIDGRLLLVAVIALLLASCQKEVSFQPDVVNGNGGPNTPGNPSGPTAINIKGDWIFDSAQARTNASTEVSQGGFIIKNVTTSKYTTQNNTGLLTITDSKFIFKGLGYSVDAIAHTTAYENGALLGEFDLPFAVTLPPTDLTYDYVRVSADSVTFPNGFTSLSGQPGGAGTASSGARLKIVNGQLSVYNVTKQQPTLDPVTQGTLAYEGQVTLFLKK